MADIIHFQPANQALYQQFAREHLPDRRTQDILSDLKALRMIGEEDAIARGVLFAELAMKAERWRP